MIRLADMIRELRGELESAIAEGDGKDLRFELGPLELELTVAVERQGGASGKIRFWVLELGADGSRTQATTQMVKLTLEPRSSATHTRPWIKGDAAQYEAPLLPVPPDGE